MKKQLEYEQKFLENFMKGFKVSESRPHMLMQSLFGKKYSSDKVICLGKVFENFINDPSYHGTKLGMPLSREMYRRKLTTLKWFEYNFSSINELLTKTPVIAEFSDNTYEQIHPFGGPQVPLSKKIVRFSNSISVVEVDDNGKAITERKGFRSYQEKNIIIECMQASQTQSSEFCGPTQLGTVTVINQQLPTCEIPQEPSLFADFEDFTETPFPMNFSIDEEVDYGLGIF